MEKLLTYIKLIVKRLKPLLASHRIGYVGLVGVLSLIVSGFAWLFQLEFSGIAAFFGVFGLLCVLLYLVIDFKHIRSQFSKRQVKYGANVTVMILIVLGIAAMVEGISSQHNFRVDMTGNQRFTLSEQTRQVLGALTQDVKILAFFRLMPEPPQSLVDLFEQYAHHSERISYEFIDPVKNPGMAEKYEIRSLGTIVLETEANQEKTTDATEEGLTNTLISVTREEKKVVYFLKGHGERELEDVQQTGYNQVKDALENEQYEVKELALMQEQAIPEDANVLILAGPENDFFPAELELLREYIEDGGKMMFLLDPEKARNVAEFLNEYGLTLGDDIIIDPKSRVFLFGPPTYEIPIVADYQDHQIVAKLKEQEIPTVFPLTQSVNVESSLPEGVTAKVIAYSSDDTWAETSKEEWERGAVEFNEEQDMSGPVPLAAVVTVKVEGQESGSEDPAKMIVFGDADFASNNYFSMSGAGNENLFLNAVSWLAGEEDLISIRPKDADIVPLMLTYPQGVLAFLLSVVILPLVVAGFGIMVFVKRRNTTR